jgi:hypothetical protein
MECLRGAEHSSPISQSKTAALDPEPVVPDQRNERLLPPEAARRLSGSGFDPAHNRVWVGIRMAPLTRRSQLMEPFGKARPISMIPSVRQPFPREGRTRDYGNELDLRASGKLDGAARSGADTQTSAA